MVSKEELEELDKVQCIGSVYRVLGVRQQASGNGTTDRVVYGLSSAGTQLTVYRLRVVFFRFFCVFDEIIPRT